MKKILIVWSLVFMSVSAIWADVPKQQCDNKSICINDKNFQLNVKKVMSRGEIVIVQLEYTSKVNNFYVRFKRVELLDAKGNEIVLNKDLSDFSDLDKGAKKVVSLKFRSNDNNHLEEPFDLTIKASNSLHGEVTLFGLKSSN